MAFDVPQTSSEGSATEPLGALTSSQPPGVNELTSEICAQRRHISGTAAIGVPHSFNRDRQIRSLPARRITVRVYRTLVGVTAGALSYTAWRGATDPEAGNVSIIVIRIIKDGKQH